MGRVGGGIVRIELGQSLRQVGVGKLPIAGIEPEVGIIGAGLGLGGDKAADDIPRLLDRLRQGVDQGALLAQGFKDGIELPFQMQAAVDDHIGLIHRPYIGLGGLVEMRVDTGAHQRRDLDAGDAFREDLGQVAGLGGGGDDAEGSVGAYACGCGRVRLGRLCCGCGRIGGRLGPCGLSLTPTGGSKQGDKQGQDDDVRLSEV